ncbi:MAG: AAC(3) family N-acetyltransferase [Lachnospiraceae bacterium]|nr:AAC(3) family N-acetyltransferase [Lachnospiraceae bacterium]
MFHKEELQEQIKTMGITPSDTVLMHTSMRAVGEVENGAHGVIDAFRDYLSDGLFLVPTHTWANVNREQPVYDVRSTVPCIGALPRAAAFRTDGMRSLHPTHSIWAIGKGAAEYVKKEENAPTPGTPGYAWDRLAEVNAKILLVGVGHDKNTFIHAVEEVADIPDRLQRDPYEVTIYDWYGNVHRHLYAGHYCSKSTDVSRQFVNFEKPLVALGAQKSGRLGNAEVRIVDAKKCRDIILKIYSRTDKDLCIEYMDIPEELYRL